MFNFDPNTRIVIYLTIAITVPVLVFLGHLSPEVAKEVLSLTASILTVAGSALAIKNVPKDDQNL